MQRRESVNANPVDAVRERLNQAGELAEQKRADAWAMAGGRGREFVCRLAQIPVDVAARKWADIGPAERAAIAEAVGKMAQWANRLCVVGIGRHIPYRRG